MSDTVQLRTLLTAHSGPDGTPDNSLENIEYILGTSVDAMELDVRKNPQGELVLSHDAVSNDAAVITLARAFEEIAKHPTMKVNCDLKEGGIEQEVFELGQAYGLQDRLIYSGSADPSRCKDLPITLYLNLEYFLDPATSLDARIRDLETSSKEEVRAFLDSCLERLPHLKANSLNMHYSVFEKAFEANDNADSYAFSLWTVDDNQDLRRFMQSGVQAITTRKVREALEIRDSLQT